MRACKFYSMTSMTARYGFHERFGLSLRFFFGFMSIHVAGKDAGQDRTRYLMDSRSDGCRNGDGRGKEDRYQRNGQGVVLHADFQRDRVLLFLAQAQLACNEIADEEAAEIVQEDHEDDEDTHVQDLSAIDGNDAADDNQDAESR